MNGLPGRPLAFTPEVLFDGAYYPICGLNFADDDEGADLVCRQLGGKHYKGKVVKTEAVYEVDAMPVGTCTADDLSVESCNGGGNAFGDFAANDGTCRAGNPVGVQVLCSLETVRNPQPTSSSLLSSNKIVRNSTGEEEEGGGQNSGC